MPDPAAENDNDDSGSKCSPKHPHPTPISPPSHPPVSQLSLAMKVVLGSESRWRRKLLEDAGMEFSAVTAGIDEKGIAAGFADRSRADASQLTVEIAKSKAEALIAAKKVGEDALLITSDQVVVHGGKIREKPESPEEARAYLQSYTTEAACTVSLLEDLLSVPLSHLAFRHERLLP